MPIFFKKEIGQLVQKEVNKRLEAKVSFADYNLSLLRSFPKFTLSLDDVSVVGQGVYENDTLFAGEKLKLKLNLMSVVRGDKYEVHTMTLKNPLIQILVDEDGNANYDIAKSSGSSSSSVEEDSEPSRFSMSLENFGISNGRIKYIDEKTNQSFVFEGLDLKSSGAFTSDKFDLKVNLEAEEALAKVGRVAYLNNCALDWNAILSIDQKNGVYAFKENEMVINALPLALNGQIAETTGGYNFDLDFSTPSAGLKELISLVPAAYTSDFDDVEAEGKANLKGKIAGPYGNGNYPAINISSEIRNGTVQYPGLPSSMNNLNLDLKVDKAVGALDLMTVSLGNGHIEFNNDPLDFDLNLKNLMSDPTVAGEVKGNVDLANLSKSVPLDAVENLTGNLKVDLSLNAASSALSEGRYAEVDANGGIQIDKMNYQGEGIPAIDVKTMSLVFNPRAAQLERFEARIGSSDISAKGKLENLINHYLSGEVLKGELFVDANVFDANEWMSSSSSGEEAEESASQGDGQGSSYPIPSGLDFGMTAKIGELIYDDLNMKNVKGEVRVKDERLSLNNLNGNTLDGWMGINGYYDTKKAGDPDFNFDYNVKGADIQKTFKAFNTVERIAPIAEYIEGTFSGKVNAGGKMSASMYPIMETLLGDGAALVLDGANIKNFPPLVELAKQLKFNKLQDVKLKSTEAAFRFADNQVHLVNPIVTWVDQMKMTLEGSHGFDYTMNYKMILELPKSKLKQMGGIESKFNSELAKVGLSPKESDQVRLDVLIGGTMTQPKITIDWKQAIMAMSGGVIDQGKEMVKNEIEEVKTKVEDKVNKEVDAAKQKAQAEADRLRKEAEEKIRVQKEAAEKKKKELEDKVKAEAEKKKKELENKLKDKIKFPKF